MAGQGEVVGVRQAGAAGVPFQPILCGDLWPTRQACHQVAWPAWCGGWGSRAEGQQVWLCSGCHPGVGCQLCREIYMMYRASLGLLAGVTGRMVRAGAARPKDEVL
jgi:hypothetical protein